MPSSFTIEDLKSKFEEEVVGKWHRSARLGNDGSAGNTLEDLLGVEENNLQMPDWGGIELKTHRTDTDSLLTLFHMNPKPRGSVQELVKSFGWRHEEAGGKYSSNELRFSSTTTCGKFTSRGFTTEDRDGQVHFVFNPDEVLVSCKDETGVYQTCGDWLNDVRNRCPSYLEAFPVYWDWCEIEKKTIKKLNQTLCVFYESKTVNQEKQFKYVSATLYADLDVDSFREMFRSGNLKLDFDARTGHDHGVKFRVPKQRVHELFCKSCKFLDF